MNDRPLQELLFERILARYQRKGDAVDELSKLLHVGRDGIYRRLRGDTSLTPDELGMLAGHYHISIDHLRAERSDLVLFNFNAFTRPVRSFDEYLENIHDLLAKVAATPNSSFRYASQTIPIFHYFYYPELVAFKLYAYGQSVWGLEYLFNKQFSFDLIPQVTHRHVKATVRHYNSVPSTGIWSDTIALNTIQQVEYALEVDAFAEPTDALLIIDKLYELMGHVQRMAEHGKKFSIGSEPSDQHVEYQLYRNEMFHLSNTITVHTPQERMVFTTFSNPNFLMTTDQKFCDYTDDWLDRVISRSTSLTRQNERARMAFFNPILKRINASRRRMELRLEGRM